jgi:hypothetical protein
MDEKGFLIGILQEMERVYTRKAMKKLGHLTAAQDGNRNWITLIAGVCADGTALPPALIYEAESGNIQESWIRDYDPETQEAYFTSSANGWTSEELGLQWLIKVFDCHTKEKARYGRDWRLLIVDGHNSHVNLQFLNWCEQHRVVVAVFPPHSTHRLQPLDVTCFRSLASFYSTELDAWFSRTQGLTKLTKRQFWKAAMTSVNILKSFKQTGIEPLDSEVVLQQVKPLSRPSTSTSGTSIGSRLSANDERKIRRLIKDTVEEASSRQTQKLLSTMEHLTT